MTNNISKTLFIPLYFKYKESLEGKAIYDESAITFFKSNKDILDFSEIDKDLASFTGTIARTLVIDKLIKNIISKHEIDFIANIGCGLDFRNRRLKIGNVDWYNIDLKEVIEFRKNNISSIPNEKNVIGDILKLDFLDNLPQGKGIFIFEGLLMYFTKKNVDFIMNHLTKNFNNCYYIIEVCPDEFINQPGLNPSIKSINKNIMFKWGNNNPLLLEKNGLEYIKGHKIMEELKDRWKFFEKNPLFVKFKPIVYNNFRIDLYKK
ncbi:class I SAM-dependent methyltransferase [Fusobacterium sp. MFO224]|uniref:class I SAM-dependent methyltransferase n=1 Tax=Fusobacterium sp. MFO224 TaxID=3378070 RepID=UPI0038533850